MSTASNRATGVPRSVTTISSPARARSIQLDSSARNLVIVTSIAQVYSGCHAYLYNDCVDGGLEDAVSALRSQKRATLVVVHDRAEAWALADRLLVLIDGRLVAAGPPRAVLEDPPSAEVARFLGYDGSLAQEGASS